MTIKMAVLRTLLVSLCVSHVVYGSCPSYEAVATKQAANLDPQRYEGFWYEVASANVFLTKGCQCTRYNYTLTTGNKFSDVFTCHKNSPTGAVTTLPNHGSWDEKFPGKMVESLGPVSPPYWVINLWGDYQYSLVYACVDLIVTKAEYVYFFSRNSTIPAPIMSDMRSYATAMNISLANVKSVPMEGCTWEDDNKPAITATRTEVSEDSCGGCGLPNRPNCRFGDCMKTCSWCSGS